MPRKPQVPAEVRTGLGLGTKGKIPVSAHLVQKQAARVFLAAKAERNLELIARIAEHGTDEKLQLQAAQYLLDRYFGRPSREGDGTAPAEIPESELRTDAIQAVARQLLHDLPPEYARQAIAAIRNGLRAAGKLPPDADVVMSDERAREIGAEIDRLTDIADRDGRVLPD